MAAVEKVSVSQDCDESIWMNNLEVISLRHPRIAKILTAYHQVASCDTHIDSLIPEPVVDHTFNPQAFNSDEQLVSDQKKHTVFLGCGACEDVIRELAQGHEVVVIEPHIASLYGLLWQFDLSEPLLSGQLLLLIPTCDNPVLEAVSLQETTMQLQQQYEKIDRDVAFIKGSSFERNAPLFEGIQAAHVTWMKIKKEWHKFKNTDSEQLNGKAIEQAIVPIQNIKPVSALLNKHDVVVISPRCVIFNDLASAFQDIGLNVHLLTLPAASTNTLESDHSLIKTLQEEKSALVLSRNRTGFESIEPRERTQLEQYIGSRLVHWWWDTPNIATLIDMEDPGCRPPHLAFARDLLRQLPVGSMWLPGGAQRRFCHPSTTSRDQGDYQLDISFVGQSRVQLLLSNVNIYLQALCDLVDSKYQKYFNEFNQLRGLVSYYDFLQELSQSTRPAIEHITGLWPKHAYYLKYILKMAKTIAFRLAAIQVLLKAGFDVKVFGDSDWLKYNIIAKEHYGGMVDPEHLPNLYRSSRINLNLNFMQVSSAINPKVLDVCALGEVVLTDDRPEVEYLFPDELLRPFTFSSLDELPDKSAMLLSANLTAYRMALREFTTQEHAMTQRAQWIAEHFDLG